MIPPNSTQLDPKSGAAAAPKQSFDPSQQRKETRARLAAIIDDDATEDEKGRVMPEGIVRPEEIIALREEAQRVLEQSLNLFETRFANLPTVNRLRELWEERRIDDKDPVWLMVEVLSLTDARSQLQFASLVRIHKAFDELSSHTAAEMRTVLNEALSLRDQIEPLRFSVEAQIKAQTASTADMAKFTAMLPELMAVTSEAIELHGNANRRARWEMAGMVAAAALIGVILGRWFF